MCLDIPVFAFDEKRLLLCISLIIQFKTKIERSIGISSIRIGPMTTQYTHAAMPRALAHAHILTHPNKAIVRVDVPTSQSHVWG